MARPPVLTIQNGVGAEDLVARGPSRASRHVAGSLTAPVERPGPHEVQWRGRGGIGLAPVAGAVDGLLAGLVARLHAPPGCRRSGSPTPGP